MTKVLTYRSRLSQWLRIKKRRKCEVDKATQNVTKNYPKRTRTQLIYVRVDAKKVRLESQLNQK